VLLKFKDVEPGGEVLGQEDVVDFDVLDLLLGLVEGDDQIGGETLGLLGLGLFDL
jgi:hypothetical protein